jgi:hypothetical protein
MANLRGWPQPTEATSKSKLPSFQFKAELGKYVVKPLGAASDYTVVLPDDTPIILDFGYFWEGEVRFTPPFDDSRMVLRGVTPLPRFSGDKGYQGAIKLHVMLPHYGLCELLSTSVTVVNSIDAMWDAFLFAPEAHAGQLPVYRTRPVRSYNSDYGLKYAPVLLHIGWSTRNELFSTRLIPPPKPIDEREMLVTGPAPETDKLFDAITSHGEVLAPAPLPGQRGKPRGKTKPRTGGPDPDINDAIPF